MSLRNLQRRVAKLEQARRPNLSPFAAIYGSFDAWVERDVLPGIEKGLLDGADMIVIIAALRRWESNGVWDGAYSS
ncbi:MAG: hypothetical protein JSR96_13930 [Proteobacteria bacterium]|nr:hypothetical protein [Pseudomonadota bacterium]